MEAFRKVQFSSKVDVKICITLLYLFRKKLKKILLDIYLIKPLNLVSSSF
jgi:hypothetical protein